MMGRGSNRSWHLSPPVKPRIESRGAARVTTDVDLTPLQLTPTRRDAKL